MTLDEGEAARFLMGVLVGYLLRSVRAPRWRQRPRGRRPE